MQDAIKMPSSFIALLFQLHRNASYLVMLLCFIYNMKWNKCCSRVNLDGCPKMWCGSLDDLTWPMMLGTTSCANSSNLVKLKLVKDLNKPGVAHMVVKTSRLPMLVSIDWTPPSFNFVGVKNSQVLTHAIVACTAIWISSRSSSLQLEELESRLGTTIFINNKLGVGMK